MLDMLEEEQELINGEEVLLSAASLPHLGIQRNLSRVIGNYLRGKRCRLFTEARVVFDDKNWFQPDVLVICDRNKMKLNYIEGAPDFVAEVLSPTTKFRDLGIKKDTYERFGVGEYWVVDPLARDVTVYLLRDGKYEIDYVYHSYSEEEWEGLTEKEKSQQKLALKLSLYDDLVIPVEEIFEE
ncbi:MAG: Uma2 family endonuclease [Selenomonadaceae bacterium]|nr:Uma2 family endonuclease [Selenomonadaceae bacterium]MBR4696107.1 Uma2 family endonuclease [Selenomonadaceae bacterium]